MIGEVIGLAFIIIFMLFCITGVALIVMDDEKEDRWTTNMVETIICTKDIKN